MNYIYPIRFFYFYNDTKDCRFGHTYADLDITLCDHHNRLQDQSPNIILDTVFDVQNNIVDLVLECINQREIIRRKHKCEYTLKKSGVVFIFIASI